MIITKQFRAFPVNCINDVSIEKVSRDVTRENFGDLLGVVVAPRKCRQKLVSMELINRLNVAENAIFLPTKRLRKFLGVENRCVIVDSRSQRLHVILFVLQKLANNVEKFRVRNAKNKQKKKLFLYSVVAF